MSDTRIETEDGQVGAIVGAVYFIAQGESFGVDIDCNLSPEILEALLRSAADTISGKNDRAAGAWGRT